MKYLTSQEEFWAGNFGTEYIKRNTGVKLLASNLALFSKALQRSCDIKRCIEFGANIGMNLKALKLLFPELEQHAIEINSNAVEFLKETVSESNIFKGSILDYQSLGNSFDLVLIKGVLIHINPEELDRVYKKLVDCCGKFLLVVEYYNPNPVCIPYRGHNDKLFKRDFAGEILDRYKEMQLVDYGFTYHRDPNFPQDDVTWFLMKKK